MVGEHAFDAGARGIVVGDVEGSTSTSTPACAAASVRAVARDLSRIVATTTMAATCELDRGVQAHARGGSGDEGDWLPVAVHAVTLRPDVGAVDVVGAYRLAATRTWGAARARNLSSALPARCPAGGFTGGCRRGDGQGQGREGQVSLLW